MIQAGDRIQIHYQTRSKQGNMIETSEHREPFEFTVGDASVIEGLNQAVIGLQTGDRKHVILSPDLAFGYRDPRLQQAVPRIGPLKTVDEGDQLATTTAGQALDIWVRSVQENEVSLDANHPLAGESIVLDLEVVGIVTSGEQSL
jgi:peptidylprolyl isomerase